VGPDTLFVFRLVIPRCAAQVQALRDLSCCLSLITTGSYEENLKCRLAL